jgi:hypothetical protein
VNKLDRDRCSLTRGATRRWSSAVESERIRAGRRARAIQKKGLHGAIADHCSFVWIAVLNNGGVTVQYELNASKEVYSQTTGSVTTRSGVFTLLRRRAAAGFVLLSMLTQVVGCGSTDMDASDTSATEALRSPRMREAAARLSGEEIFQGLFFGVGEPAKIFPEIWSRQGMLAAAQRYQQTPDHAAALEKAIERLSRGDAKKAAEIRRSAETQLAKWQRGEAALPGAESRAQLASALTSVIGERDSAFFGRFANEMKSGNAQRVSAAIDNAQSILAGVLEQEDLLAAGIGDATPNCAAVVIVVVAVVVVAVAVAVAVTRQGLLGGPSYERDAYMLDLSQRFAPPAAQ